MYTLPDHVQMDAALSSVVRHEWDDFRPRRAYGASSPILIERLQILTPRAMIAVALGCAEWVVGRFQPLLKSAEALLFLEAAWLANIDQERADLAPPDRDEWLGPVRGPVWSAMAILADLIEHFEDENEPAVQASWMANLALHVLPDPAGFKQWLSERTDTLAKDHRRKLIDDDFEALFETDLRGPLLPPEASRSGQRMPVPQAHDLAMAFASQPELARNPHVIAVQGTGDVDA